eukprot:Sspe_Gene.117551::Locus_109066_Transcript_1_1_Confidence_1.000_Length_1646::g.117551::m.117551
MEARFVCWQMEHREVRPKPSLGTVQLAGVLFLAIVGGAYGIEGCVSSGGPRWTIIGLLALPWIWGLPVALCIAELASCIQSNAGPDMWIAVTYPTWFTIMNVLWTFFINRVDNSLYPNLFVDYLAQTVDLTPWIRAGIKIGFVAVCCVLNIIDIDIVGLAGTVVTILIIAPTTAMFFYELPSLNTSNWGDTTSGSIDWPSFLPLIAWNVSGFDSAGHIVEEVKTKGSALVRALVAVLVAMQVVYLMPIFAGLSSMANRGETDYSSWDDGYWVTVGKWIGGRVLSNCVLAGGMLSAFGFMTSLLCTTSRALQGHATLGLFPTRVNRLFTYLHPQFRTPVFAIIFNSAAAAGLSILLEFDTLVDVDQVLYSLRLISILVACLILRIRHPTLPRPFAIPGGVAGVVTITIFPVLFCAVCVILGAVAEIRAFVISMGIVGGSLIGSLLLSCYWVPRGLDGRIEYSEPPLVTQPLDGPPECSA